VQEKPLAALATERGAKAPGVIVSQEAESGSCGPSILPARHGEDNGHGTAQETETWMDTSVSDMPRSLRWFTES